MILLRTVLSEMSITHPADPIPDSVTILEAALTARVHVAAIYKLRSKLGAFKRDGVWHIPTLSLRRYIEERAARARQVVATAAAMPPEARQTNSDPR
jgi:hypothetical protein